MSSQPLLAIADGRKARPRKAPAPTQSELRLHIDVADVLRRFCRPNWRWFHVPNGEVRDKRAAAKLRAMGVRAGVPDLLLIAPDGTLRCLELKARGGRLSDAQEDFQAFCVLHGIPFVVASTIDEALAAFDAWDCLARAHPKCHAGVTIGGAT